MVRASLIMLGSTCRELVSSRLLELESVPIALDMKMAMMGNMLHLVTSLCLKRSLYPMSSFLTKFNVAKFYC